MVHLKCFMVHLKWLQLEAHTFRCSFEFLAYSLAAWIKSFRKKAATTGRLSKKPTSKTRLFTYETILKFYQKILGKDQFFPTDKVLFSIFQSQDGRISNFCPTILHSQFDEEQVGLFLHHVDVRNSCITAGSLIWTFNKNLISEKCCNSTIPDIQMMSK